jgi:hypothetical protein
VVAPARRIRVSDQVERNAKVFISAKLAGNPPPKNLLELGTLRLLRLRRLAQLAVQADPLLWFGRCFNCPTNPGEEDCYIIWAHKELEATLAALPAEAVPA